MRTPARHACACRGQRRTVGSLRLIYDEEEQELMLRGGGSRAPAPSTTAWRPSSASGARGRPSSKARGSCVA
eukprot:366021-Chlamydomonas_euryale.AAC.19